ncbi:hypothetical protein DUI87_03067 [Hirundo rustica rustica]|uniref:Uncharacterized protein n=1 Tax=Hirundo rustica rustica TaxID=333673 RepID=A0A3M0LA58_HIRRU|nr:hypothetical protein DUI87_03067 [Hirundo rustica rustica]
MEKQQGYHFSAKAIRIQRPFPSLRSVVLPEVHGQVEKGQSQEEEEKEEEEEEEEEEALGWFPPALEANLSLQDGTHQNLQ